jgi:hypothetical protein
MKNPEDSLKVAFLSLIERLAGKPIFKYTAPDTGAVSWDIDWPLSSVDHSFPILLIEFDDEDCPLVYSWSSFDDCDPMLDTLGTFLLGEIPTDLATALRRIRNKTCKHIE